MPGLLLTLAVAYLALLILLLSFERRLIFFPLIPGRLSGDWSPSGLGQEEVWLTAADGVHVHAWWIPAKPGRGADMNGVPTFLSFHGNAANIAWRADVYRFLRDLPANVLALEYRGYGRSEGTPSEKGIYADGDAAYDYAVRQRGIPPARVIAFGQSLGTAVAAHLAANHPVGGLVLEAPFPSARALARGIYWFVPGLSWLIRSRFEISEDLARAARSQPGGTPPPLLVLHCTEDPVIPFAFGKEVYKAAPGPKSFLPITGQCHEEATLIDPAAVRQELLKFVGQARARE
jgi:fermentation-respiration switch protein FrsA (DUF1100 family)